uniref:polynucleotide adenylyltransferase n=1 Tax=Panagrellus redivivus TaxID=6233 RepID=A0A7E4V747_PANRE
MTQCDTLATKACPSFSAFEGRTGNAHYMLLLAAFNLRWRPGLRHHLWPVKCGRLDSRSFVACYRRRYYIFALSVRLIIASPANMFQRPQQQQNQAPAPAAPNTAGPQYGVSQPICMLMPSQTDLELTDKLQEELRQFSVYETEDELQRRLDVLRRINALVKNWVRKVSEEKGLTKEQTEKAGGKLYTFGSYRLGVHTRGADIDSLCVAPRHVERSDFFSSFFQMLKEDENATELHAVEEAFVPVIKLKYNGIELDILFARLALREIPDDQSLNDDNLLRNLDEKSIRSLNGCRVADEILRSIPNKASFTVALRAVKLWAKNHSVYSNSLGFLGGVSWAILVARVCQLYPNASAANIIEKFFLVYSTWEWPHPVFLKDGDSVPRADIQTLNELVWDPRNRIQDRYHLMPIITPAYPEQNSTFNVTKSTRKIITNEILDGLQIILDITGGTATWNKLFEEVNFFSRYKHYICLQVTSASEDDHLVFSSLVESKIRHLISFSERNPAISMCHINPKQFKPLPKQDLGVTYENPHATLWFIGLEFNRNMRKNVDLTSEMQQFTDLVIKAAVTSGSYKETMVIKPFYIRRNDLEKVLPKRELTRGRHYNKRASQAAHSLALKNVNQKQIRGEKAGSVGSDSGKAATPAPSDPLVPGAPSASGSVVQLASTSQPSSPTRKVSESNNFDGPVDPSAPLLHHSTSTPNLEAIFTNAFSQPAPYFPPSCTCSDMSFYCLNLANNIEHACKKYGLSKDFFTITTVRYLGSLDVCRAAMDNSHGDMMRLADAEKTLVKDYLPSKKSPLDMQGVMRWDDQVQHGPHPSYYAMDYQNEHSEKDGDENPDRVTVILDGKVPKFYGGNSPSHGGHALTSSSSTTTMYHDPYFYDAPISSAVAALSSTSITDSGHSYTTQFLNHMNTFSQIRPYGNGNGGNYRSPYKKSSLRRSNSSYQPSSNHYPHHYSGSSPATNANATVVGSAHPSLSNNNQASNPALYFNYISPPFHTPAYSEPPPSISSAELHSDDETPRPAVSVTSTPNVFDFDKAAVNRMFEEQPAINDYRESYLLPSQLVSPVSLPNGDLESSSPNESPEPSVNDDIDEPLADDSPEPSVDDVDEPPRSISPSLATSSPPEEEDCADTISTTESVDVLFADDAEKENGLWKVAHSKRKSVKKQLSLKAKHFPAMKSKSNCGPISPAFDPDVFPVAGQSMSGISLHSECSSASSIRPSYAAVLSARVSDA